jgi:hypothetical protein
MLSLDEMIEAEYAREREWCEAGNSTWVASLLEELPEEATEHGNYGANTPDLVTLWKRTG